MKESDQARAREIKRQREKALKEQREKEKKQSRLGSKRGTDLLVLTVSHSLFRNDEASQKENHGLAKSRESQAAGRI